MGMFSAWRWWSSNDTEYQWTFHKFPPLKLGGPLEVPFPSQNCQGCQSIFNLDPEVNLLTATRPTPLRRQFPLSFSAIFENAENDRCHLCFLILQSFQSEALRLHEMRKGLPEDGVVQFYFAGHERDCPRELVLKCLDESSVPPREFRAKVEPRFFSPWRREPSTNSATTFELARNWVGLCKQKHERCRLPQQPNKDFKPSRLIDLGVSPAVIRPRLLVTAGIEEEIAYVTLSHCWGSGQIMQLTNSSLVNMTKRISTSELSRTFRDAMETAKQLGFRYLWIDSLCIIQDDTEDWRIEASMMADIYHNSSLNIAATKSNSGEMGCFTSRKSKHVEPAITNITPQHPRPYFLHNYGLWNALTDYSPLYSRGWVVQEFTLAPRILHFAENQVLWECKELQASETWPGGIPRRTAQKLSSDPHCISRLLKGPEDSLFHGYLLWDNMVSEYTAAALTFPQKDKLIAISGMAKKMELDDELIAGLWRKRLPYQLLWMTGGTRPSNTERPSRYQAPSWSWASINGCISTQVSENCTRRMARNAHWRSTGITRPLREKVYVDVKDVQVFHQDEDPRAPLTGGFLKISGPMLIVYPKRFENPSTKTRFSLGVQPELLGNIHGDNWFAERSVPGTVRCLFVLLKDEENPYAYGIFVRATGAKKGEYQRLGLCEVVGSQFEGNTVANLEMALRGGLPADDDEVEDVDRMNEDEIPRYVITIV